MNSESSSSRLKRKYDTFSDSTPSESCLGKYDVFLNFRGEDTRKGFVSHLYDRLKRRGIITYKDDRGFERGEPIGPLLFKAIEESRSAIVVLSRNYASSTWCLQELLHILKCCQEKDNDYKVFPVFHDVEPTEVRKQIGDFGKGFDNIKGSKSKIEEWRKALVQISNISGWDLKKYETEVDLIENLVENVETAVPLNDLSFFREEYVGMDVRVDEVNKLLHLRSKKVLAVWILGMRGIGKTTVAQLIFDQIQNKFEGCSFVENVKELMTTKGLSHIQELILNDCLPGSSVRIQSSDHGRRTLRSRLRHIKVLIVLDDVDNPQKLEYLIGKGDNWHRLFGEGSRIIITTRDKHLLMTNGMEHIYEVPRLRFSESSRLLLEKAFKGNFPSSIEEYRGAIDGILRYVDGHPLALEILGSSLHERNVNAWMDTLDQLKQYPGIRNVNVEILKVSFDELDEADKKIFLDMCLFPNLIDGYPLEEMLRSSNLDISISNLVSKSLITTKITDTGCMIYCQKWVKVLLTKSLQIIVATAVRVWDFNDVQEVLTNNTVHNFYWIVNMGFFFMVVRHFSKFFRS